MGNPSNWISELKKGDFWVFEDFFFQNHDFQAKNGKKYFSNKISSECPKTCSGHKFMLFLPYQPFKGVETAKTWHLWCFW